MTAFLPRPFLIPSILYFLVSLVCTQIPLFNYLGFEFSFVIGVVASLVAGISTISLTRGSPESAGSGPAEAGRSFRQALGLNLLLLVIPLAVMSGTSRMSILATAR